MNENRNIFGERWPVVVHHTLTMSHNVASAPSRPVWAEGLSLQQWAIAMPTKAAPATLPAWHGSLC